jgi:phosphatidylserine decarboxylase
MPVNNIKLIDDFWLKNNKYSLVDMFGPKHPKNLTYSKFFEGGLLYQGFLSVFCYHRWHSPIDGIILDDYFIEGTYFLDRSQFI